MKKVNLFLLFHAVCVAMGLLTGCKADLGDCFTASGPIVTERRNIAAFQKLEVLDNVDVIWHQSDSVYALVTAGQNLLSGIRTQTNGATLSISNQNSCNWTRRYDQPCMVHLYSPPPDAVAIRGFGDIKTADTLRRTSMLLQHYGASDVEIKVRAEAMYVDFNSPATLLLTGGCATGSYNIQNFGKVNGLGFAMGVCRLKMEGENNVRIAVTDTLLGTHLSNRTVFLKGNPVNLLEYKAGGRVVTVPD